MTYSKIQFDKRQINRILVRCKNARQNPEKNRVKERDNKRFYSEQGVR